MTDKLRQAAQQALRELEIGLQFGSVTRATEILRAALEQPAVTPGYKLVPVEPTPEMKDVQTWDYGAFRPASEIWADMLNAAPEATAQDDDHKPVEAVTEAAINDALGLMQPAVPPSWAISQAKETLEWIISLHTGGLIQARATDALAALNAAPEATAVQKEPVAWLNPYGGVVQVRATGHEKEHFTIPLYTHHTPAAQPQTEGKAVAALTKVLHIIQNYLPPDGPNINDAMSEIIGIVDPWPLDTQPEPLAAQKEQP